MIEFEKFVAGLLNGYRSSYDIEMIENDEDGLYATAHMHMEQIQKFLMKEFVISSSDADEYVYIYHVPHLSDDICEKLINKVYEDGFPKIKLDHVTFNHQHMCTRLVALFICDDADAAALERIKKCRIYKSFQFSLKGWMEMHTCAACLSDGSVISNRYGRETAKYLKKHVEHNLSNM